jgi:hypothetical protein
VSRNQVATFLQDLKDRDYIAFDQSKDDDTNRIDIFKIQMRPAGRDLVEGLSKDKAVQLR